MLLEENQIHFPSCENNTELLRTLKNEGYACHEFPGCTTDETEYLQYLETGEVKDKSQLFNTDALGMAFYIREFKNPAIKALIDYLKSDEFHETLRKKFDIEKPTRIDTYIQKYLTGYEISPHPDVRAKSLTYLMNINQPGAEELDIHTQLLKFTPEHADQYTYWDEHPEVDRSWVPWDWCYTVKEIRKNNALIMFEAHNRSLHAIKLDYNHLPLQRTQLYGNLWYK